MEKHFDMNIKISAERAEIVVEQANGSVIKRKTISKETFYRAIMGSRFEDVPCSVGFLPDHCFSATVNKKTITFFLRCPELYADITYHETEYPGFPIPRLVFAFDYLPDNGRITDSRLAVVKDERLTADTQVYLYPFSNVHENNRICLGNNSLPIYKDSSRIHTLMPLILSFPNNDDMFTASHNKLELEYPELLEQVKDKDPAYYYSDVLIPDEKTLKDFMNGMGGK